MPGLGQRGRGVGRDGLVGFVIALLKHKLLYLVLSDFFWTDLVVNIPLTKLHILVLLHLLQHRLDCALDAGLEASAELLAPAGRLCVSASSLELALGNQTSDDATNSKRADTRLLVKGTQPVLHERTDAGPQNHGVAQ